MHSPQNKKLLAYLLEIRLEKTVSLKLQRDWVENIVRSTSSPNETG